MIINRGLVLEVEAEVKVEGRPVKRCCSDAVVSAQCSVASFFRDFDKAQKPIGAARSGMGYL
jgi:hypothetical protein